MIWYKCPWELYHFSLIILILLNNLIFSQIMNSFYQIMNLDLPSRSCYMYLYWHGMYQCEKNMWDFTICNMVLMSSTCIDWVECGTITRKTIIFCYIWVNSKLFKLHTYLKMNSLTSEFVSFQFYQTYTYSIKNVLIPAAWWLCVGWNSTPRGWQIDSTTRKIREYVALGEDICPQLSQVQPGTYRPVVEPGTYRPVIIQ
jgi:hypothetical protein